MGDDLLELQNALEDLKKSISTHVINDDVINVNWQFIASTKKNMLNSIQRIEDLINVNLSMDLDEDQKNTIQNFILGVEHQSKNCIPHVISHQMIQTNLFVFINILETSLKEIFSLDFETELHKARSTLRAIKSKSEELVRKLDESILSVENIEEKIAVIIDSYDAADKLPTTLKELEDATHKISKMNAKVEEEVVNIQGYSNTSYHKSEEMNFMNQQAMEVLENCEKAYSAATTVGLAAAFAERSENLKKSMNFWIISLGITLILGAIIGMYNFHTLLNKIDNVNFGYRVFFSFLTIGGPIWFAWICTKQIGHRFKLSEDYAFKASISRAYEGFRKEASRIDPDLEKQLIASVLQRFDELPMRFVEPETHGSPWQELFMGFMKKKSFDQNTTSEKIEKEKSINTKEDDSE